MSLFEAASVEKNDAKLFQTLDPFQEIQEDFRAFDLSTHGHPMSELRRRMICVPKMTAHEAKRKVAGARISICGLVVVRQRPPTAKGVMFSTLEDETGFLDLVFWKDLAESSRDIFLNHSFVIIKGRIEKDRNTVALIVESVEPLWDEPTYETTPLPVEALQFFH